MEQHDNLQEAEGQNNSKTDILKQETSAAELLTDSSTESDEQQNSDQELLSEIEQTNAEDAEDEGNNERHKIPLDDYDKLSLEALVDNLEKLIKNEKPQAIKSHVSAIRDSFKSKYNALIEEKKDDFINDGGNEIDFYFTIPAYKRFKTAYRDYRNKLNDHYKSIEVNLKENLKVRLEIIDQIKSLIDVEENINNTYNTFKDLQKQWRNAGPIQREKYNNTWNTYHHHVERFYDFLSLNRELRDLDFKHNLEKKLKLIEQAEALATNNDINYAFRELQILHKLWKEELGPVAPEHRELIWEHFKAITKTINDKRKLYFDELEKTYEDNLVVKEGIIEKISSLITNTTKSHKAWQKQIKEIDALREAFYNAGKVPLKDNEKTWKKFKDTLRTFNRQKNKFYKDLKKDQYENLQKKLDLVKIAEDNKNNEDFEATTPLMKKIQSDWKAIGHVPRKDSDKIWKRFKTACNAYFERLNKLKDQENTAEKEAFIAKTKILETLNDLSKSENQKADLEAVNTQIDLWQTLGRVSANKRFIETKFQKALSQVFKKIGVDKTEAELIKYDNKLEYLNRKDDDRSLENERFFIKKKIDEAKASINQLENNLQFFTSATDNNPVIKDVHAKIDTEKEALEIWKAKLTKLREF